MTETQREFNEIWELTVPGTVWVSIVNERGRERAVQVGGRGGKRLRISPLDRELTQERIVDPENDPFLNGALVRVDTRDPGRERSDQELTTEALVEIFGLETPMFIKRINALSEVNVRRMKVMCEDVDATQSQALALKNLIDERYPITSGDTEVYRELKAAQPGAGR